MKNIFDHYFSPGYNSTKFKRLKIKAGKHKEGNQGISFPLWPGLDHPRSSPTLVRMDGGWGALMHMASN